MPLDINFPFLPERRSLFGMRLDLRSMIEKVMRRHIRDDILFILGPNDHSPRISTPIGGTVLRAVSLLDAF